MQHISTTPFGARPVSAGLLASQALAQAPALSSHNDKWQLFDDLRTARLAFGLTDRDLGVLNALLTFLPDRAMKDQDSLMVFPSNAALTDRAHGMAESTLRRHLAALVQAGIIARHDSPNGKRYARRDRGGQIAHAFGFSLRPLLARAPEIAQAAEVARDAAHARRLQREALVLHLRDGAKLLAYAEELGLVPNESPLPQIAANLRRALRRVLSVEEMAELMQDAQDLLNAVNGLLMMTVKTEEMHGNDVENGRHHQNSKTDSYESEPCPEKGRTTIEVAPDADPVRLPLALVVKACPDIETFGQVQIRQWPQLVSAAGQVRGMMGISHDAWTEAVRVMGAEVAAVTVAAILQKGRAVNQPGAYLRSLTLKAAGGGFSPGPMIMALLSPANSHAA
jgi:replication initiation protein RepC